MSKKATKKPDIIHKINDNIMNFKYHSDINTAPKVHVGLNPLYLQMRQEVHNLHKPHLKARKERMKELFIQDFLQENIELQEVGFGYINTYP